MPPDTVYVGRPSDWGNPFKSDKIGREKAIALYRLMLTGKLSKSSMNRVLKSCKGKVFNGQDISFFKFQIVGAVLRKRLHELYGKDLACWCPLDKTCHADVLIELIKGG